MKNPNVKKAMKYATIGGASIIVLTSAMQLLNIKTAKEAIMPIVTILVGIAAFTHATMPEIDKVVIPKNPIV